MPRNVYFSQGTTPEKRLFEDITIEALKIYGHDVYYIPRKIVNTNSVFNEDALSKFGEAFQIEMYVENTDGFEGDGDLLTKFGVEVRDSMTLILSVRRWEQLIGRFQTPAESRPQEGDLIYFPLVKGLFSISFVEDESPFYQLQNLPTFKLTCETFEYGNEAMDTGVAAVDAFETDYATRTQLALGTGVGTYEIGEDIFQKKSTSGFPESTHVHNFPIWKTITGEVSTISNTTTQLNTLFTKSSVDVNMLVGSSDGKTIQVSFGETVNTYTDATHVTISNMSESYLSDFEGTFEIQTFTATSVTFISTVAWPAGTPASGITAATVKLEGYGYAPGTTIEVTSATANKPFAHVNGAVNNSATIALDNNGQSLFDAAGMYGVLDSNMTVAGKGVPDGVTIQSITSQAFDHTNPTATIVLSQKVTLSDNTPLTFSYPASEIAFNTTSDTAPGNIKTSRLSVARSGELSSNRPAASYIITTKDAFTSIDSNDPYADNEDFETIGNNFIDFSESNPFGEINITS